MYKLYNFHTDIFSMKMKKFVKSILALSLFCFATNVFAAETEEYLRPYELDKILREIKKPGAPVITEDYIIFTADPKNRYVGIAFDFEDYQIIHPFKLLNSTDEDGNKTPVHLFYCYERTHKISQIKYRLVIDGLWTTDPLNPEKIYDDDVNLYFSKVSDTAGIRRNTEVTDNSTVHFIYKGEAGQTIRLAGNFSNWDPWIYQLRETYPGFYELELPLPDGKYYYNYYIGLTPVLDTTNPERTYLKDGKAVSVIQVY